MARSGVLDRGELVALMNVPSAMMVDRDDPAGPDPFDSWDCLGLSDLGATTQNLRYSFRNERFGSIAAALRP
jgi:hypothetical protein